jgi:hypothetical protein
LNSQCLGKFAVLREIQGVHCAITPYSALSQASCWRPDDQKGFGLLPEEVEVYFGETLHEKSPAEAVGVVKYFVGK